ncbi:Membrane transport protein, putative [Leishmania donovani]|uniref:Membrane transport protein, putative n=1 Tax=Leishmania donovani TaxID=5661 RepID=A0A3S5H6X7_LEIDO|nr:Membrane transport protein, putative [Leishmania donovani]
MDILGVTFIAVSKVIVAVLVGVFTTNLIPSSTITLHNFSFLISALLLTSLTLSNTAKSIDLEVLFRCSILILFSLISIASGLLWGVVLDVLFFRPDPKYSGIPEELRKDVRLDLLYDHVTDEGAEAHCSPSSSPTTKEPGTKKKKKKKSVPYVVVVLSEHFREVGVTGSEIVNALEAPDERQEDCAGYRYAAWVGCSTQNGVTLPLSLMSNVASSISFIDMAHSAAYIFVFSISYMLYLWSACPAFVEAGQKAVKKQRLIREIMLKHKRMMARCDATTQTLSLPVNQVLESHEDLVEDVEVDGCDSEAGQASRLECQVNRFTQLYLAASDPSSSSTSCSDSTSPLEAGCVANTDAFSSRADRHAHSATYSFDLITSLQNSFTQTTRSFARTSGKRGAAEVTFKILGTPATRSPTAAGERAFAMATAVQLPYDWAATGFVRFKYESEVKAIRKKSASEKVQQLGRASWVLVKKLMTSPPFLSVVLGIFIGIVPPVRRLFEHWPLSMVMDAIRLIGEGSIPSSLLLLGANLAGSSSANAAGPAEVRLRNAEQNTEYPLLPEEWQLLGEDLAYARWYDAQHTDMVFDSHESFSLQTLMQRGRLPASMMPGGANAASAAPMNEGTDEEGDGAKKGTFIDGVQRTLFLKGIRPTFVWGIIIFRMLISPTLSFFLLIFLIDKMPFLFGGRGSLDKTLIMVLMVELAAPTAINSTLLFNAYKFMTYQWAKMLFFQYILCILSMVMWASIGLSYVMSL